MEAKMSETPRKKMAIWRFILSSAGDSYLDLAGRSTGGVILATSGCIPRK
jgi:hypothetical protein